MASTLDLMKSENGMPFLVFTIHFFTEEWLLESIPIAFKHFPGSHASVAIANYVRTICNTWSVRPWINVSDNASNLGDSLLRVPFLSPWLPHFAHSELLLKELLRINLPMVIFKCGAHTLNLFGQDVVENSLGLNSIFRSSRELAAHFKRSTLDGITLFNKMVLFLIKNEYFV